MVNSSFYQLRDLQSLKHCSDTAGHVDLITVDCRTNLSFLCPKLDSFRARKVSVHVCMAVCLDGSSDSWGLSKQEATHLTQLHSLISLLSVFLKSSF